MIVLDKSVRTVILQFSFSNPNVVPASVRCRRKRETPKEQSKRKSHPSGTLIIEPTMNCKMSSFFGELLEEGYELVDASFQERVHLKNKKQVYYAVRFVFCRKEFAKPTEEFKQKRDDICFNGLGRICNEALWRIRVYLNPFYENGEEIIGQKSVSINLEARSPLINKNGQPILRWTKDENGKRIGDQPMCSQRIDCSLHCFRGKIQLDRS